MEPKVKQSTVCSLYVAFTRTDEMTLCCHWFAQILFQQFLEFSRIPWNIGFSFSSGIYFEPRGNIFVLHCVNYGLLSEEWIAVEFGDVRDRN